jgi:hypothetical protein
MSTPRERAPLPGREVEAAVVKADVAERLDGLRDSLSRDEIGKACSPPGPGAFSPGLDYYLVWITQQAIDLLGVLRRCVELHGGDTEQRRGPRTMPQPGIGSAEIEIRETERRWDRLTTAEVNAVRLAVWDAARKVTAERVAGAGDPKRCPKCGGEAFRCKLDGDTRWLPRSVPAPARLCWTCKTVTPNNPPGAQPVADRPRRRKPRAENTARVVRPEADGMAAVIELYPSPKPSLPN